ncbi:hypothetical protein B0I35DRAFT_409072 [Stachybotrys elegans]|uniref:SSCRP protein n=1 Tax=Stachybotrys elegans TaxID=80388 RepID=A0A8K0SLI8_9HYPO|nr:hypothetical protein B0I35DRAFT_409072 [Stachybotrys elegans]
MKIILTTLALAGWAAAKPQMPPPLPDPLSTETVSPVALPTEPAVPLPVPEPPAPTASALPGGPICECGYTYCASVLMAMKRPWTPKLLTQAYCSTPNAACPEGLPHTNVTSALFICLCDGVDQEVGTHLHLLCGCDTCLNVNPDFRGRCETPCYHD